MQRMAGRTPMGVVDELFRTQHAVVADRQVRRAGVTWEMQRTKLRSGAWTRFAPGVLALSAAPATWEQGAMAATLSFDGLVMLSGRSAGRLHGLDGFATEPVHEIVLPPGGHDHTPATVGVRWS